VLKHIVSKPKGEELETTLWHDDYTQVEPVYPERYPQNLSWWDTSYTYRYELFETLFHPIRRSILVIGSGLGYFLQNVRNRGLHAIQTERPERAAPT